MITAHVWKHGAEYLVIGDRLEPCRTFIGKSTDTKPVEGVRNSEWFYESDTQKVFAFDGDTDTWVEQ